jgi:hypothetical protein
MLTAFRGYDDVWYVAFVAAPSIDEFKRVQENLSNDGWFEPEIMDFFIGRLKGFGMGCIFTASSEAEIDQMIAKYSMRVMSRAGAMDEHMAMRSKQPKDALFSDPRPLYEILGVDMGDDAPKLGKKSEVVGSSFGDVPTENVKKEIDRPGLGIAPNGRTDYLHGKPFRKFYRLDIHGTNVDDLLLMIESKGSLLCSGQENDTAWVGFPIERLAMTALDDVHAIFPEITSEIYCVDRYGDRLAPVATQPLKKLRRPWTGDDISEKEIKKITTDEFVFAGYAGPVPNRSTIFFTPKVDFDKTNAIWDGDVGPYIEHLLSPRMFEKRAKNVYWVMINDHDRVLQLLTSAGFVESLGFQAWVNSR